MDDEEEHEVDSIVGHKFEDDSQYFEIRWANHNASEDSWVLEEMLSCPQILRKYKKKVLNQNIGEETNRSKNQKK